MRRRRLRVGVGGHDGPGDGIGVDGRSGRRHRGEMGADPVHRIAAADDARSRSRARRSAAQPDGRRHTLGQLERVGVAVGAGGDVGVLRDHDHGLQACRRPRGPGDRVTLGPAKRDLVNTARGRRTGRSAATTAKSVVSSLMPMLAVWAVKPAGSCSTAALSHPVTRTRLGSVQRRAAFRRERSGGAVDRFGRVGPAGEVVDDGAELGRRPTGRPCRSSGRGGSRP